MAKCYGVGTKECYSVVSKDGDYCRSCQFEMLQAENKALQKKYDLEMEANNRLENRIQELEAKK